MIPHSVLSTVRRFTPRSFRNWIREPTASVQWVLDEIRHLVGADTRLEMSSGWVVRCHPAASRMSYRLLMEDPAQREELGAFIRSCAPGMLLFDLGSHFGVFTMAALHHGGADARAIAVDPSPTSIRILSAQAKLNGVDDRVDKVLAAVSDRTGSAELVSVGVIGAGYYTAPEKHHSKKDRSNVESVTVDQLVARVGRIPTHVKIDVEGYESAVLRGASELLAQRPAPIIFLEMHNEMMRDRGLDPAEPLEILEQAGYSMFSHEGEHASTRAILAEPLVRIVTRVEDD